jgi:hypothetical protein
MFEPLVKPQSLDNDIAVMQILQLLGQISLNDLEYILKVTAKVYQNTKDTEIK